MTPEAGVTLGQIIIQAGAAGVMLLVLGAIVSGRLRTSHEVTAWRERSERSEKVADALTVALDRNTEALKDAIRALERRG